MVGWGEEEEGAMAEEGMKSDIGLSCPDPEPVEVNLEVFPLF